MKLSSEGGTEVYSIYGTMKADAKRNEALEASIDKGLEESSKHEVRPHQQVMSDIRARYNHECTD